MAHQRAFVCFCAWAVGFAAWTLAAQDSRARPISYLEARPIIEAVRDRLPAELVAAGTRLEETWPRWVERRDRAIRARVDRGDEDSIVHLLHYGTSFTTQPAVTDRNLAALGGSAGVERIVQRRIDDLLTAVGSPSSDERVQFARSVLLRNGGGRARTYLQELRQRVLAEYTESQRTLDSTKGLDPVAALAAYATMYRDRGLSSDTSLLPAFAIDRALESLRADGTFAPASIRRVAVVGPGLDFVNKDDGYDFYPQQTIQPFALVDSLIRLGLARQGELLVTTFDLSPRVNQHIDSARARARSGGSYTLHLPLNAEERWNPDLLAYWRRAGDSIGTETTALSPPPGAGKIQVRAVRVPAALVSALLSRDLNIVFDRLEPLTAGERFDLVIATNTLVYYEVFEQMLALVNIGGMLRSHGVLLSNTLVPPVAPMMLSDRYTTVVYSERQRDFVFAYTAG